jgi:hypothetical protein
MAITGLIVEVKSENTIEQAQCRIESDSFTLNRTGNGTWVGAHKVDVVGLVQYSVVIVADTRAKWGVTISKSGGSPFVDRSSVVPDDTTIDVISGMEALP